MSIKPLCGRLQLSFIAILIYLKNYTLVIGSNQLDAIFSITSAKAATLEEI